MRDIGLLIGNIIAGGAGVVLADRGLSCLVTNPSVENVAFGGIYLLPFLGSLSILVAGLALMTACVIAFVKLEGVKMIRRSVSGLVAASASLLLIGIFAIQRLIGWGVNGHAAV